MKKRVAKEEDGAEPFWNDTATWPVYIPSDATHFEYTPTRKGATACVIVANLAWVGDVTPAMRSKGTIRYGTLNGERFHELA